jgi:hypothetical protein
MAEAVVHDPEGKEIERFTRRSPERCWLTVQGQASNPTPVEGGGYDTRWRYRVGTTVSIDGVPYKRLGSDRHWHDAIVVSGGA